MSPIALHCRHLLRLLAMVALLLAAPLARAQSFCSSDGQPRPMALLERFISADCQACWSDPGTPRPGPRELAIDWVVPGSKGEDAPLSTVASQDALRRLQALSRKPPAQAEAVRTPVARAVQRLRVARSGAFNDYLAASIELKPGHGGPWRGRPADAVAAVRAAASA